MVTVSRTALAQTTWTYEKSVGVLILISIVVRLICAANVPLAFDEALYWRYSKHLAAGFIDHPAMNPLMIRIGTAMFGDTELGVRFMAVLLGLPASWAVWRAGAILFRDERIGATAALFYNLTAVMTLGSLLATSDEVVVTMSCFILYFLAKLNETERGAWWLAVGAAVGLGLFSKYTTVFLAAGILAWLILVPERRKWLLSPWTYAGALVALVVFSPVLIWNADHHWASAGYQFKRMVVHKWSLRFLGELLASQFGLATPPIFVLGCIGLFWGLRQQTVPRASRVLLGAMIAPILLYFSWHSLHERVQGNWPEPIYPAFVIAAALAARLLHDRSETLAKLAVWSERIAVPFGLAAAGLIYLQAMFAIVPMGARDPTARMLGVGWTSLAPKIDAIRVNVRAPVILTTEYPVGVWLSFYLPPRTPVEQITERLRWVNEPAPDPKLFDGQMLYVCKNSCPYVPELTRRFEVVEHLDTLARERNGIAIEQYSIYRLARPTRAVLDPLYTALPAGQS